MATGSTQDGDDFESAFEDYPVRLETFEGPLDLLLHLIRKNELDIYDIPLTLVTQQYLEYLDVMRELNLDVAAEFLLMAATLIHIKSRMLLPRPDPTQDGSAEDPRDQLVRRLLEHQKYRAAAELLHEREILRGAQWTRPDSRVAEAAGDAYEPELEVDLFSLLSAFRAVLERVERRPKVLVPPEQISIERRIEQLLERIGTVDICPFEGLFEACASRADVIVTFLAVLEMIRLKLVRVYQSEPFGPIRVYRRVRPDDAPRPLGGPGSR